ncbi:Ig-like domain-containing protein [Duffyella gerundensis]|uniref:Ig-like domain-containing protein n=1 Tax=Duffyella gerundensis TaxID=1619313 RepID=UPI003FD21150
MNILSTPGVKVMERDDKRPTFSAILESEIGKGGQVEIVIGEDSYTVMIDPANGSWSFTWPEDLKDGTYSLSIRATDSSGNDGIPKLYNLVISTTPPEPPTLFTLDDDQGDKTGFFKSGETTDDLRPTLSGLAKPGAIVVLMRDGEEIGSAVADAVTGLWSLEPNQDLADGENSLTLVTRDTFAKKDRESEESEPFTIVVGADGGDNGSGGQALITHGWDDSGENVGELSSGALTSDTTPELRGTAPAESIVRVQYRAENGRWVDGGSAVAGPGGDWSWTAPELGAGNWEFRVSAAASGGWSDEFALEVSGQAQAEVTITHGWDSEGAYTGELRSGALTDDNKPQLFGRAEANSLVYVHTRLPGGEWERVGSAHAGPDGRWTLETERLSAGSNELTAGNSPAARGGDIFNLEVVTADPAAPQIVDIYDNTGPITGYMGNPDVTDDRTPRLEGRAPTGAIVVIYQDGVPVGSTVAAGGLWQFEVPALTEDGTYSFTTAIRSGGTDGPQSPAWEIVLNTSNPTDVTLEITSMTADSGISNNDFITNDGSANRTLSGTLNRELAQGERVLVHNGNEWLLAVVDGLQWSVVDTRAHSTSWAYQAKVENAVNGADSQVAEQEVIFDNTTAPPTISGIYDNSGNIEQLISEGGNTTDATPVLRGTAEPDSIVYIYLEGSEQPIGSTTAVNGQWYFTGNDSLNAGKNTFYIKSYDKAGNSADGDDYNINLQPSGRKTEDFQSYDNTTFTSYDFGGFTVTTPEKFQVSNTYSDLWGTSGKSLHLGTGGLGLRKATITFKSELSYFEMILGAIDYTLGRSGTVIFYDNNNNVIGSKSSSKAYEKITFNAPNGSEISKVEILTPYDGDGVLVDNIVYEEIYSIDNKANDQDEKNKINEIDVDRLVNKESNAVNKGQLDLTGEENNPVTLNLNDLLTSGEKNLFIENGKTQLLITGDENDTVQLDDLLPDGTDTGDWIAQNGTVTVAGVEYQVFSHSGEEAEVLIQQGIKTELI